MISHVNPTIIFHVNESYKKLHLFFLLFSVGSQGYGGSNYGYSGFYNSKPEFEQTTQNISVSPGDRAVLKCRVKNLGTKTVRRVTQMVWCIDGRFTTYIVYIYIHIYVIL